MFTGYFLSLVLGAGESGTENSKILGFDPHVNDMWSLNLVYPPHTTAPAHHNKLFRCCVVYVWIVASRRLVSSKIVLGSPEHISMKCIG